VIVLYRTRREREREKGDRKALARVLGTVGVGLRAGNHLRSAGADELAGRRCSPGEARVAWRRLRVVFMRPHLYRALVSPLFLCVNLGVGVAVMVGGGGGPAFRHGAPRSGPGQHRWFNGREKVYWVAGARAWEAGGGRRMADRRSHLQRFGLDLSNVSR
jgi:hypothetical protein